MLKKPVAQSQALSNAERQRKFREENAAGRLNLVIDANAKAKLVELAETKGITIREMLEELINNANS